jgi:Mg-chelatase subunit ChlI
MFSVLGERFLQVRWHRPVSEEAGVWAIRQQGNEEEMQNSLRTVVRRVFDKSAKKPPRLSELMQHRIASLAEIIAIARTHVYRSSYGSREIEYAPESEANTRISKGLAAISKGIAALHGRAEVEEQDLQDAFRVGLDCLQDNRRRLFLAAARGENMDSLHISKTTCQRELEELQELKVLRKDESGYQLVDRVSALWAKAKVSVNPD